MLERILSVSYPLIEFFTAHKPLTLNEEYTKYIAHDYPQNHTFKIIDNKLIPKHKLASRYKRIQALYPKNLTSLVDIGCSKGFFVLSASEHLQCPRTLGIDVNPYALNVCRWLKQKIENKNASFEKMRLHELAERIDEIGGPFQTVLVVNAYQYIYFGSDHFRDHYLDHDRIFRCLRKICSGRVIFNNRLELKDCQNVDCINYADKRSIDYTEDKILVAAEKYFKITRHGTIGRYPLYAFDAI